MWKVKVNVDRQPTAKFAGHVTLGFYQDFRLAILSQIFKGICLADFFLHEIAEVVFAVYKVGGLGCVCM